MKKIFPFAKPGAPLKKAPEDGKGETGDILPPHQRILFEAIIKGVPDALVLAGTDRRILMCNPAVTKIFGYEESELLGLETEVLYESPG